MDNKYPFTNPQQPAMILTHKKQTNKNKNNSTPTPQGYVTDARVATCPCSNPEGYVKFDGIYHIFYLGPVSFYDWANFYPMKEEVTCVKFSLTGSEFAPP